ncbi:Protein RtcB [Janthinobacterium sp. CG23_2]|nr:Protein RtcB [Janthinobacterium sp. CG23_2]CUU26434.1 Protein RtcB [Janthinobacterium sp. CG23_2]
MATRLVLRTSDKDGRAHGGFQWPESGLVECPDWQPTEECGAGLHGILWPEGDWSDIKDYDEARWQVVEVDSSTLVQLDGKVKFPRGTVVYSGCMAVALNMVAKAWLATIPAICADVDAKDPLTSKKNYAQIGSSGDSAQIGSSGDSAQIGSSGGCARIGSSGHSAQIGSSGHYAQIGSSGGRAQIGSSGGCAQIGSSGGCAQIGSSGHYAQIGSSGDYAQIGSSGDSARIGSSGHSARIGSSGDSARIGSSGHSARIGSSGHSAQIGSSGHSAQIGSSGDSAQIGSSGGCAQIDACGMNAVIASAGSVRRFRAAKGGCVSAPWHDGKRTRFAVGYVGENIKADTWYAINAAGEFVEAA